MAAVLSLLSRPLLPRRKRRHKKSELAALPSQPDYVTDFYETKQYEYIDGEKPETVKADIIENLLARFQNIDYGNYEFSDLGILDFT